MTVHMANTQTAPYPHELTELLAGLAYRPGFEFRLTTPDYDRGQGSTGLSLIITVQTPDSYDHDCIIRVAHLFPVPPAAYDVRSWRRWLFDRIGDVETHERCEFFTIAGDKPYAPSHGPGNDPYLVREVGTELDRRTSFRGEVNE